METMVVTIVHIECIECMHKNTRMNANCEEEKKHSLFTITLSRVVLGLTRVMLGLAVKYTMACITGEPIE